MDYHITETGALVFTLDADEISEWSQEKDEKGYIDLQTIFVESGLHGNCDLETLLPEEIGALTDAPLFGIATRDDDGEIVSADLVWFFSDYMITDPVEILLGEGCVTLSAAPENKMAA